MTLINNIAVLFSAILIVGCTTTGDKHSAFPDSGPPMVDIYRDATAENLLIKQNNIAKEEQNTFCDEDEDDVAYNCEIREVKVDLNNTKSIAELEKEVKPLPPKTPILQEKPLYRDYTRSASNEIYNLFPRLINPDIVIYIYPHLATKNAVPVPGYATVIPLYNSVQYALPGEVADNNDYY